MSVSFSAAGGSSRQLAPAAAAAVNSKPNDMKTDSDTSNLTLFVYQLTQAVCSLSGLIVSYFIF